MFGSPTIALMDDRHKVLTNLSSDNADDLCYDVVADPAESTDVASERQELVAGVREGAAAMAQLMPRQPLRR